MERDRHQIGAVAPFGLRLPAELRNRIEEQARQHRRSLNSQMIVLLERALPAETKAAEVVGTTPAE